MEFKDFAPLIQTGGLLAFTWVVWNELKTQRAERNVQDEIYNSKLIALGETIAIIRNILDTMMRMTMTSSQRMRVNKLADETWRERPKETPADPYEPK
jgi:hypothetical protein